MASIYKNSNTKSLLMEYYDEKLNSLNITYETKKVSTDFGETSVILTGNPAGKKVVLFHGINAGSPIALEPIKDLNNEYCFIAIDTVGQATKSDEHRIDIRSDDYALWANQVLDQLKIVKADFIGISYGAYILQKLLLHKPEKIGKCIFIVPSGIVNGPVLESFRKLSFPLMKFMFTKKEKHLRKFLDMFIPAGDNFMFKMQKALLLGVNIDFRRPGLLRKKDLLKVRKPIYIMTADNDIFFPGKKVEERSKELFATLKEVFFLKNCKHMPSKEHYPEIQKKIKEWIGD